MRDFITWLEGFSVDFNQIPPGTMDQYWQFGSSGTKRGQAINTLYRSPFVRFDPEKDDPLTDLVQVVPLQSTEQLPNLNIANRLPSFEGASIYYAFALSIPKQPQVSDPTKAAKYNRIPPEVEETVKTLKQALAKIDGDLEYATTFTRKVGKIIDDAYQKWSRKAEDFGTLVKLLTKDVNAELLSQNVTKGGQPLQLTPELITKHLKMRDMERRSGKKQILTARTLTNKRNKILQELEQYVGIKQRGAYYNVLQNAFIHKLKFPITMEDHELQANFVELAVENYYRLHQRMPYAYVLYPESRGSLNIEIAQALGKKYNAQPIGLEKLPTPTSNWSLNNPQDSWRVDTHRLKADNPSLTQTQWRDKLQDIEARVRSGQGQAKNLKGYLPYIRNSRLPPNYKELLKPDDARSGFRNRFVLIVDDDVSTGGTLQSVHKLIAQTGPRRIDIFAPIKINFAQY